MRPFGIVPDEPVDEFAVEDGRSEEIIRMVVHKLILDGPVEPFTVSIHLRCLRVGMIMNKMKLFKLLRKVLGKL